jgi:phospholipase C
MSGKRSVQIVLALTLTLSPASAVASEASQKIQHVVMIMQENRSFDTYFGTYPHANGIPGNVCVPDPGNGGCAKPFHNGSVRTAGGPHGPRAFQEDVNGGKMDGFVRQAESVKPCDKCDVMGYYDARDIPNYWAYAQNFVLQDNLFASAASWSLPEHLFMVSGWSAVCPFEDTNPLDCASTLEPPHPPHRTGQPIKSTNAWTDITFLLDRAAVSWRYYVLEGNEPDCQVDEAMPCQSIHQQAKTPSIWNPLPNFTDVRQDHRLGNIQPLGSFYSAVDQKGQCGLPNVSWIVPNAKVSEHPLDSAVSAGQAYVTTLINSIMRSPCWTSTTILLSWDDWGGFYDHVVPPKIDENGYGLRVPGLVISPYAKQGLIDHQQLSHDAYLKFVEDVFLGGARLNPATDGRPDRRPLVREELAGDLINDFNFSQTPRPPLLLPTDPPS